MGTGELVEATAEHRAHVRTTEAAMNRPTNANVGGVKVTNESAFDFTPVYAAIRVLAESVASLPCITYERDGVGGKRRAYRNPHYTLLHDAPSPEQTAFSFFETMMGHVLTWGNGYAELVRDGRGVVREMYPIPPHKIRIQRVEGELTYFYDSGGHTIALPYTDVLHIAGLGFDGLQGYSPIQFARKAIGLGMAAEEFGAAFFGNATRPSGVLSHPGHLTPEAMQRLRESWENMHRGPKATGRVVIVEEGMSWTNIGIPPEDAQFLQTRRFAVEEIARIYRVSPMHLQDMSRATYSNYEHSMLAFNQETLRPWIVKWEQELRRKVFRGDSTTFPEFNLTAMLRGDTSSRYEAYRQGRESGFLSVNEIRALENLNPIGPDGDGYLQPLNFEPLGAAAVDSPDTSRAMLYPVVVDAVERTLRVERNAVGRRVKRHLERDNAEGEPFILWVDENYSKFPERLTRAMSPVIDAAGIEPCLVDGIAEIYAIQSKEDLVNVVRMSETATEAAVEIRSATEDEDAFVEQVKKLSNEIMEILKNEQ